MGAELVGDGARRGVRAHAAAARPAPTQKKTCATDDNIQRNTPNAQCTAPACDPPTLPGNWDLMPLKVRRRIEPDASAHCWHTACTLLAHCWHRARTLLASCLPVAGALLAPVGTLLAPCWHPAA